MKKLLLTVSLLLTLVSCTRIDFGLQFFSFYVKSEVDDMFDLDTPQKQLFSKKLSVQLDHLKREQFPVYADYLEKIVNVYQTTEMTGEKASQLFDEGSNLFFNTPPQWKSTVEAVVITLKDDQFKTFEEYFYEKLEKHKSKHSTPSERHKRQLKGMENWIEETIEDLSSGQEDRLEQYVKLNPKPFELSYKSQEYVFNQFKEVFPDPEKRKEFTQKFLTDWRSLQIPEYLKARDLYMEKLKSYVIDLSLNLSEKQKKNLIENLTRRIEELRKISTIQKPT